MEKLHLSTTTLDWAAARAGLSLQALAEQVVAASKVEHFLNGEMTVRQAEKVAKKTRTPFGFLFLPNPPQIEEPSIPDLRQLPHPEPLSQDFKELLDDVLHKQEWYAEYLREIGQGELDFVGRFKNAPSAKPAAIAEDIRKELRLTAADRASCSNEDEYTALITERAEAIGILVMRNGIVKSSTKRGLSVKEFRGFAIADPHVPVIFLNGKDASAAWVFTLAHEIAHIWIGASGVSDLTVAKNQQSTGVERRCNQVAAELLVPKSEFVHAWGAVDELKLDRLRKQFKVSRLVIARRALDLGYIEWEEYQAEAAKTAKKASSPGGNPYATIPIRNSRKLTQAVIRSSRSGELMLREAGRLLNVNPGTVAELARRSVENA